MTKRQARVFAVGSTLLFTVIFIALTIDSHARFGELTHEENITPAVLAGHAMWHRKNYINCHTLLGEGAYFAPDLTKITQQRGSGYLKAFLKNPSNFYSEQKNRRLMPDQHLSDAEIDNLIAFLDWISHIDNQGWPPRPILVAGASIPGTVTTRPGQIQPASTDPVAKGQALFGSTPPGCSACHSVAPGVNLAGPTLADIGNRAARTVKSPDYKGQAHDAAGYIRESIVSPSAYLVPGPMYSSNGQSLMPSNFGKDLTPEQIDSLVAFLSTLK